MPFFFLQIQEQKARTGPVWRLVSVGGGGVCEAKGVRGWIQCKYCVHMYVNVKIRPVETIPRIGRGKKGEWWREWIQLLYTWYTVRTFISVTMYLQHNNINK
jgi:hypothetical protein